MTCDGSEVTAPDVANCETTTLSVASVVAGSIADRPRDIGPFDPASGILPVVRAYFFLTGAEILPVHWPARIPLPAVSPQLPLPLGATFELRGDDSVIAKIFVSYAFAEAGSAAKEAHTRQVVGRKIDRVWALQDGWRGPDSLAPSQIARELYLAAVQVLPGRYLADAQPTPTAEGGIHLEWTRGRYDFSADITGDGQLILSVLAPNADDDSERVIEAPTKHDLVDFICRGV